MEELGIAGRVHLSDATAALLGEIPRLSRQSGVLSRQSGMREPSSASAPHSTSAPYAASAPAVPLALSGSSVSALSVPSETVPSGPALLAVSSSGGPCSGGPGRRAPHVGTLGPGWRTGGVFELTPALEMDLEFWQKNGIHRTYFAALPHREAAGETHSLGGGARPLGGGLRPLGGGTPLGGGARSSGGGTPLGGGVPLGGGAPYGHGGAEPGRAEKRGLGGLPTTEGHPLTTQAGPTKRGVTWPARGSTARGSYDSLGEEESSSAPLRYPVFDIVEGEESAGGAMAAGAPIPQRLLASNTTERGGAPPQRHPAPTTKSRSDSFMRPFEANDEAERKASLIKTKLRKTKLAEERRTQHLGIFLAHQTGELPTIPPNSALASEEDLFSPPSSSPESETGWGRARASTLRPPSLLSRVRSAALSFSSRNSDSRGYASQRGAEEEGGHSRGYAERDGGHRGVYGRQGETAFSEGGGEAGLRSREGSRKQSRRVSFEEVGDEEASAKEGSKEPRAPPYLGHHTSWFSQSTQSLLQRAREVLVAAVGPGSFMGGADSSVGEPAPLEDRMWPAANSEDGVKGDGTRAPALQPPTGIAILRNAPRPPALGMWDVPLKPSFGMGEEPPEMSLPAGDVPQAPSSGTGDVLHPLLSGMGDASVLPGKADIPREAPLPAGDMPWGPTSGMGDAHLGPSTSIAREAPPPVGGTPHLPPSVIREAPLEFPTSIAGDAPEEAPSPPVGAAPRSPPSGVGEAPLSVGAAPPVPAEEEEDERETVAELGGHGAPSRHTTGHYNARSSTGAVGGGGGSAGGVGGGGGGCCGCGGASANGGAVPDTIADSVGGLVPGSGAESLAWDPPPKGGSGWGWGFLGSRASQPYTPRSMSKVSSSGDRSIGGGGAGGGGGGGGATRSFGGSHTGRGDRSRDAYSSVSSATGGGVSFGAGGGASSSPGHTKTRLDSYEVHIYL